MTKKRYTSLICVFLFFGIAARDAQGHEQEWPDLFASFTHPFSSFFSDDQILEEVNKHLGIRYRTGGSTKQGVDCSGFVKLIYMEVFGVDLPHSASSQHSLPIFNRISIEKLRPGDLIFFSPTGKKRGINHVGIYLTDGNFAHAVRKRGVVISRVDQQHWKTQIVSAKRIYFREALAEAKAWEINGVLESGTH